MGFLKRILGEEAPGNKEPGEQPYVNNQPRAFDKIMEAIDAWKAKDDQRAERLFLEGINHYERTEPDGVSFALGRFGAFLKDRGRDTEALEVLERALANPDVPPAVWGDHADILTRLGDADRLLASAQAFKGEYPSEALLHRARRSLREGDSDFAERVARSVFELAYDRQDRSAEWAAAGTLGLILEKSGRPDEAQAVWQDAFDSGSDDPVTADRLSMMLERAKELDAARIVIEAALKRRLPANVDERLRKRLLKCIPESRRRSSDVTAFTVRQGDGFADLAFQTRLSPPVRQVDWIPGAARCLGKRKEGTVLTDVSMATGEQIRRVEGLPPLNDVEFDDEGFGCGWRQEGRIGDASTGLTFLSPDGAIVAVETLNDGVSEVAGAGGAWYVGCRDGYLYAFDRSGVRLWGWETPGARSYAPEVNGPSSRPCPYYVTARAEGAVVSSMGDVYAIGNDGTTLWHRRLPTPEASTYSYSLPVGGSSPGREAFQALGVTTETPVEDVKRAYRRLALETHPDRNPLDPTAQERFIEVQSAYESILSGEAFEGASVSFSIIFQRPDPTVAMIKLAGDRTWVSSTDGRIHRINEAGVIAESRVLGDSWTNFVLDGSGDLAAAWSDRAIFVFRENKVVNSFPFEEWAPDLVAWRDSVVVWKRNRLTVADELGRISWNVDFSKPLAGVVVADKRLLVAAGVVAGFDRSA